MSTEVTRRCYARRKEAVQPLIRSTLAIVGITLTEAWDEVAYVLLAIVNVTVITPHRCSVMVAYDDRLVGSLESLFDGVGASILMPMPEVELSYLQCVMTGLEWVERYLPRLKVEEGFK